MSNKLALKEFMHILKEVEKKSSTSQEEKPKNLKASIKGGYPEENVRLIEKEMDAQGFTNPFIRIAILSVCAKERGLKTDPEISYKNTSNSRIKDIFGSRFENVEDEKIDKLKKSAKDFFNYVYGGELPENLKDGWPEKALDAAKKKADVLGNLEGSKGGQKGDGYRYRGMGFNQLTGRYAYRKRGKAIGEDLESNPDTILDPGVSSKVAVGFIKKMMERKDGRMKFEGDDWQNGYTNQEDANIAAAGANAGWKTNIEKAVKLTTSKNKGFSYDDMPEEKKSEENKSKEDSSKKESNISDHIKNKKEGNEFREWVNDNHEDYAKETKLDRSGSYKNSYIKDAWEKFGDEYLEFKKKNTFDKDKVEVLGQMKPYPKGGLDFNYVKIRQGDSKGKNIVYAVSTKDNSIYARSGGSKSSYEKLSEALLKEVKIGDHNISKKDFFKDVFPKAKENIKKIDQEIIKKLEEKEKEIEIDSSQNSGKKESSVDVKGDKFSLNGVVFQSMPTPDVASKAEELLKSCHAAGGKTPNVGWEASEKGKAWLRANMWGKAPSQSIKMIGGDWHDKGAQDATDRRVAWSGNFWKRCHEKHIKPREKNGGTGISDWQNEYNWNDAAKVRERLYEDPESFKGKVVWMVFRGPGSGKAEKIPINRGDSEMVFRGANKGKSWEFLAKSPNNGQAHMNIFVSDGEGSESIGGNLGDTVQKVSGGYEKAMAIYKRVKVLGTTKEVSLNENLDYLKEFIKLLKSS